jgi:hypothetical protein
MGRQVACFVGLAQLAELQLAVGQGQCRPCMSRSAILAMFWSAVCWSVLFCVPLYASYLAMMCTLACILLAAVIATRQFWYMYVTFHTTPPHHSTACHSTRSTNRQRP